MFISPTQFSIKPVHIVSDSSLSEKTLPKSTENYLDGSSSSRYEQPAYKEELLERKTMTSSSTSITDLPESKEDILP